MPKLVNYKIFLIVTVVTGAVVCTKYWLHLLGYDAVQVTTLHTGVISSAIFVMSFMLSAVIADYKESERIPAFFAATVEDMYHDAREIHRAYPQFNLEGFRLGLIEVLAAFRTGTRSRRHEVRQELGDLGRTFSEMEAAGVPPNFIVKLKSQHTELLRSLFRVNYIQRISFIPSAYILVRSIVVVVVVNLLFTNIEPFYGGLLIAGTITYIMVYMVILIHVISTPFQGKGQTQDDISLFLIREARDHLQEGASN